MMRHPIFLTYGILLLGFVSFANFRGLSPWGLSVARSSAVGSMRGRGPVFIPGGGGGPHGK